MSILRKTLEIGADDTGSVMVIVAAFVPLAILFIVFVVDVGKAFEHKRHLQLQADAGVLAAAQEFQPCNNEKIRSVLKEYSGKRGGEHLYNKQIGETADKNIHEEVNKLNYFDQAATKDGTVEKAPCEANMIDLKVTETETPLLFKALNAPFVNAHARVEIRQENETSGFLPVSLVDSTPRAAAACFVNEETGAILKSTQLVARSVAGTGLVNWTNEAAPVGVPITTSSIGVHVALSGKAGTTSCTDPNAKVYDLTSSNLKGPSLLHIQGWSLNAQAGDGGSGHPKPVVREVRLTPESPPAGCSEPYFSNPAAGLTCKVGVSAVVDFGSSPPPAGATVTFEVGSEKVAVNKEVGGKWTASGIAVKAQQGSVPVTLKVTDTAMKGTTLTFAGLQRTYTAVAAKSGPIQSAGVSEGGVGDANSFRICETGHEGEGCEPKLVVTIGTTGLKNAESVSEPFLKFPVEKGIKNCPPSANFKGRLAGGCEGHYAILPEGGACATSGSPVTCLELENGIKANDFAAGLNERILGSAKPTVCTSPNHWSQFPNLPKGDPRIVTIVLTPFEYEGEPKPIEGFATFYITGWEGQGTGFNNPCEGQGDDPAGSSEMVGHFIKYTNTTDSNGGGSTLCEPDAFGQCVAVLTQ